MERTDCRKRIQEEGAVRSGTAGTERGRRGEGGETSLAVCPASSAGRPAASRTAAACRLACPLASCQNDVSSEKERALSRGTPPLCTLRLELFLRYKIFQAGLSVNEKQRGFVAILRGLLVQGERTRRGRGMGWGRHGSAASLRT